MGHPTHNFFFGKLFHNLCHAWALFLIDFVVFRQVTDMVTSGLNLHLTLPGAETETPGKYIKLFKDYRYFMHLS